jgi:hypothetical protein
VLVTANTVIAISSRLERVPTGRPFFGTALGLGDGYSRSNPHSAEEKIMSTRRQDAALAEKLKSHHAAMIKDLDRLSGDLAAAAASGADAAAAKRDLEAWIRGILVPHAEEEEATTYRAAGALPEGRLLIQSMLDEHGLIRRTASHVSAAANPVAAGTYARALFDIFRQPPAQGERHHSAAAAGVRCRFADRGHGRRPP